MANNLYLNGRQLFLTVGDATPLLDWTNDNVRALLVDGNDYTFDENHVYLSDVPSVGRVANSAVTGRTVTSAATSDQISFPALSGDSVEALIIYVDTGTEATSELLAYFDVAVGLPVIPAGGDVLVTFGMDAIVTEIVAATPVPEAQALVTFTLVPGPVGPVAACATQTVALCNPGTVYAGETVRIESMATLDGVALDDVALTSVVMEVGSGAGLVTQQLPLVWNATDQRWELNWDTSGVPAGTYYAKVIMNAPDGSIGWEFIRMPLAPNHF